MKTKIKGLLWHSLRPGLPPGLLLAGLALPLGGCQMGVLDPAGAVGSAEKDLIITSTLLMLIVVVPVIVMTLLFAWRYRATNTNATYAPTWSHSVKIEVIVWAVPLTIVAILAVLTWVTTHALDPYRPLTAKAKPLEVQVVALDWKWLFVYPDLGIATVNQLTLPVGTPLDFKITSDSVMNSFFVPQLGSQIYAMAGMQTQDHLIANRPGTYQGLSANFSGDGFADMHFVVDAVSPAKFEAWVKSTRAGHSPLDAKVFRAVEEPSAKVPPTLYSSVQPDLFNDIIAKYQGKAQGFHSAMKED